LTRSSSPGGLEGDSTICSGGTGNDDLRGWAGSDWIDGGAGVDRIDGGTSSDVCILGPPDTPVNCP
jgi:Ca2+-binding RTX toxin-like protein